MIFASTYAYKELFNEFSLEWVYFDMHLLNIPDVADVNRIE